MGKNKEETQLAHIVEGLRPLAIDIETIQKDATNARKHSERNLEAIQASLSQFGQRSPIVVQRSGMVCRVGNGRLEAAKRLGWKQIAAVVVDDDNLAAVQFAIADNRTAELAEWDNEVLTSLLKTMKPEDIAPTGFTQGELDAIVASLQVIETKDDALLASADEYAASVVRQIVLVFGEEEYQRVVNALAKCAEQNGLSNNTEVVMFLLESNGYAISGRQVEDNQP